jgi:CheY-like chemotaxis protein
MLEEVLQLGGYEVCGIASTVAEAVALGERHKPDLAVIDLRLAGGDDGVEAARQLASRQRIGILYASGNVTPDLLAVPAGEACIAKPYVLADIIRGLEIVEQIMSSGTASPPLPPGLHLLRGAAARAPEGAPGDSD